MGQAAAGLADWSVVTSDNPRSEDPQAIIQDIIAGMQETQNRQIIVDRREAIFEAVRMLKSGDVLLIAGKGHEDYQVIQGKKYPFDEVKMVHEAAADV
jgi:UDP-N-acetylmuramoyl-L-alanyl-D-glutamate--2,6-diaminopimelate ligase